MTEPTNAHNPYQPTTTVRDTPPNPGSDEAITQGCRCPRMDNGYGRGYLGGMADDNGKPVFVVFGNCPMHGNPDNATGTRDA